MKTLAILLSLSLGQQVSPSIVPVARGALLQPDGGIVDVSGGAWFSTTEIVEMGKDHAQLRAENEHLRAHAADVPYQWILGALAAGAVIGAASGMIFMQVHPK